MLSLIKRKRTLFIILSLTLKKLIALDFKDPFININYNALNLYNILLLYTKGLLKTLIQSNVVLFSVGYSKLLLSLLRNFPVTFIIKSVKGSLELLVLLLKG